MLSIAGCGAEPRKPVPTANGGQALCLPSPKGRFCGNGRKPIFGTCPDGKDGKRLRWVILKRRRFPGGDDHPAAAGNEKNSHLQLQCHEFRKPLKRPALRVRCDRAGGVYDGGPLSCAFSLVRNLGGKRNIFGHSGFAASELGLRQTCLFLPPRAGSCGGVRPGEASLPCPSSNEAAPSPTPGSHATSNLYLLPLPYRKPCSMFLRRPLFGYSCENFAPHPREISFARWFVFVAEEEVSKHASNTGATSVSTCFAVPAPAGIEPRAQIATGGATGVKGISRSQSLTISCPFNPASCLCRLH